MADTDNSLRQLFIRMNIVYIIFACVVFILAIVLDGYLRNNYVEGYHMIAWIQTSVWLLGFGILLVASLGIYGAKKEKKWPFIMYITASAIGVVMMVSNGAQLAKAKQLLTLAKEHGMAKYYDNNITIINAYLFAQLFLAAFEIPGLALAIMNMCRLNY